ncbi:MAG: V-type ATP synthase subunit I [Candidatus Atribacteria bacterium]|nr:V-type ATP synthase subunit I [Candidatus Atribacteria bacterium]
MKKVEILIHRSLHDETFDLLQDMGVLQITSHQDFKNEDLSEGLHSEDLERNINEVRYCLDFMNKYRTEKQPFLESFFPTPIPIQKSEFLNKVFNHSQIFKNCQSIEERFNTIRASMNRLNAQLEFLNRIESLPIALEDIGTTRYVKSFLLEMNDIQCPLLQNRLEQIGKEFSLQKFQGKEGKCFAFLIIHQDLIEPVETILAEESISILSLPQAFEGTPKEAIQSVKKKIQNLEKEQADVEKEAVSLLKHESELKITLDYYTTALERRNSEAQIFKTHDVCLITGWAIEETIPVIEERMKPIGKEWVISQRDPDPGEDVPIALENGPWTRNFDVLTNLYGLPNYTEIDPTPFVAIFFFAYFGICLGDAVYGLIVALIGFMAPNFIQMPDSSKRFFRMLAWGGIASMIFGALTGSWMGDTFDYLPSFLGFMTTLKNKLMIINPISNPLPMIIVSIVIGIIQVLVGLLIAFAKEWKRKNYHSAIYDKLSWFLFILSIVIYIIAMAVIPSLKTFGLWLVVATALFLVGTQGRSKKNIILRIFSGLYSLYGITSYLGDVLSYSRLFALGLTTTIIAMLGRTIAGLFGSSPYFGWIIWIVIFIGFTIFNILMSGLGAFVHSARLNYVEFFTKFYENGGKPFQPLQYKTKYVKFTEE